jgi:hypothetical protein
LGASDTVPANDQASTSSSFAGAAVAAAAPAAYLCQVLDHAAGFNAVGLVPAAAANGATTLAVLAMEVRAAETAPLSCPTFFIQYLFITVYKSAEQASGDYVLLMKLLIWHVTMLPDNADGCKYA